MVRFMSGVKLVDRKNTEDLMKMQGLKKTTDRGGGGYRSCEMERGSENDC